MQNETFCLICRFLDLIICYCSFPDKITQQHIYLETMWHLGVIKLPSFAQHIFCSAQEIPSANTSVWSNALTSTLLCSQYGNGRSMRAVPGWGVTEFLLGSFCDRRPISNTKPVLEHKASLAFGL